ncbi:phosphotransferase [Bacillus mangrovi]|uniref:Phosphotransferase n=1 Tax=Metabacillus mangrovi TaxID=1491830 RepID=A0A7X2V6Y8_9BACI|nr:fructosamine kinase family protein [Metabacillus mangrovi]MTH55591.1 phosphotransferase [Metabacillus mangrovi]
MNLESVLSNAGDRTSILKKSPVRGGDINDAWLIETENERYFLKTNHEMDEAFFKIEETGLKEIVSSNTISVPAVYQSGESEGTPYLLMEWIEGDKTGQTEALLGQRLAAMHRVTNEQFGYGGNTCIGRLRQPNGWYDSWTDYYCSKRLFPQMELAVSSGRMTGKRRLKMDKLLSKLDLFLPHNPEPSLLHGDLWGGNWIAGAGGEPYLVDPSVFYGDRELEIAFTELFGGFGHAFYEQYREAFSLEGNYEDRKPLYQLYYLLAHLNMFGESYGSSVDRILNRYI